MQLRRERPDMNVKLVGDALSPRHIEQAVYEGHMATRTA